MGQSTCLAFLEQQEKCLQPSGNSLARTFGEGRSVKRVRSENGETPAAAAAAELRFALLRNRQPWLLWS
eukprot:1152079-Pelagomonas_calceolata.AAC.20